MSLVTLKVIQSLVSYHKSAVITLVERLSKAIITLKPKGRKASDIETTLTEWFRSVPETCLNLLPLITERIQ